MPSPLVWIVLVAGCLGFGVLMGRATGPDSPAALAARRVPLKLLLAQTPAATSEVSSSQATPPPLPSAQATPEPGTAEETTPSEPSESASEGRSSEKKSSTRSGGSQQAGGKQEEAPKAKPPKVKHVFVVMLSDEPYATAFGPASPAHYLTGTLERQGKLLVRYYAVAHEGLANGIALLSGQGPTEATVADCPTYADISSTGTGTDGQVLGQGCAYPASTATLPGQLTAKHLTWKGYVGGIDEGSSGASPCALPSASVGGEYQASRNPFVYFHSILGSPKCASEEAGIGSLKDDLASKSSTANFSYIAPGPCEDGAPAPCAAGKPAGMAAADSFLKRVIPEILHSKAYKHDGLLAITVDNAPSSGEFADSSSCCGQPRFPNLPAASGAAALSPQGGGQVGLLLLSPLVKKGGLVQDPYNHFSLLASIEGLFGLPRLGYAGLSEVKPFSTSLLSAG